MKQLQPEYSMESEKERLEAVIENEEKNLDQIRKVLLVLHGRFYTKSVNIGEYYCSLTIFYTLADRSLRIIESAQDNILMMINPEN